MCGCRPRCPGWRRSASGAAGSLAESKKLLRLVTKYLQRRFTRDVKYRAGRSPWAPSNGPGCPTRFTGQKQLGKLARYRSVCAARHLFARPYPRSKQTLDEHPGHDPLKGELLHESRSQEGVHRLQRSNPHEQVPLECRPARRVYRPRSPTPGCCRSSFPRPPRSRKRAAQA